MNYGAFFTIHQCSSIMHHHNTKINYNHYTPVNNKHIDVNCYSSTPNLSENIETFEMPKTNRKHITQQTYRTQNHDLNNNHDMLIKEKLIIGIIVLMIFSMGIIMLTF